MKMDGFISYRRSLDWTEFAQQTVDCLGERDACALAGLAYCEHLEFTQNPLLGTFYGRCMLRTDPLTRKSYSMRIMKIIAKQKDKHLTDNSTRGVPAWWVEANKTLLT